MLKLHGENVFPITFQYLIIMEVVEQVSKETDWSGKLHANALYIGNDTD